MSIVETIAEQRIREAMANGDFDQLPGRGKRVNLDEYFKSPPEQRAAHALLKNAGIAPQEIQMRRTMNEWRSQLAEAKDDITRREIRARIGRMHIELDLLVQKARRRF